MTTHMTSRGRAFLMLTAAVYALFLMTLVGKGAMLFPDEARYGASLAFVDKALSGDFKQAFSMPFGVRGRPGEVLAKIPSAAPQYLASKLSAVPLLSPESLMIPQTINVIVLMAILWMYFQVSRKLFEHRLTAYFATGSYALLTNTFIYVRHVLPYDSALLLGLCSLNLILRKERPLLSGLLWGAALTVYPGFYFLTPVVFCVLIGARISGVSGIFSAVRWVSGLSAVFFFFEALSRLLGESYFSSLGALSKTVVQGSFDEGFSFLPKYAHEVEGPAGVLLLLLAVVFLAIVFRDSVKSVKNKKMSPLAVLSLSLFVVWLCQACLSCVFRSMVFYGRLLHGYFPLIVWMAAGAIEKIKWRSYAFVCVFLVSCFSFVRSASKLYRIAYPRDTVAELDLEPSYYHPHGAAFIDKDCPTLKAEPRPLAIQGDAESSLHFVLVNFCFYPKPGVSFRLSEAAAASLKPENRVFSEPSALAYAPYFFEGDTPETRQKYRDSHMTMEVYRFPVTTP